MKLDRTSRIALYAFVLIEAVVIALFIVNVLAHRK